MTVKAVLCVLSYRYFYEKRQYCYKHCLFSVSYTHLDVYKRQEVNKMVDQSYYKKADEIIEHYERCAASLIPIMQDIQAEYRYLPAELLTYVAGQIGVTEAKAFSVATFYENFSFEPKGKYIIKAVSYTHLDVYKRQSQRGQCGHRRAVLRKCFLRKVPGTVKKRRTGQQENLTYQ